MARVASFVVLPVLAVGVVLVLFANLTATHTARTQNAAKAAAVAPTAPARPGVLDASSGKDSVTATDLKFSATRIEAPAGKLALTLRNAGKVEHELVLLKTNADPASLKVSSGGRVSEAASVGEISETAAGASKSTTFDLKPGRYVYVCNIPGHYAGGMHGSLVVK
jgi:uncharacterized cupredoxin-like copper-binding protein